jgi:hypothetical protein
MQQIKIDVIDNGFILSYIKRSALTGQPEGMVKFFSTITEVTEVLTKEF